MLVKPKTAEFSSADPHRSQEARILDALLAAKGAWVSAQTLSEISLQYSSRIHSLRKLCWKIDNKVERAPDGRKRGYFRIRQLVTVSDGALLSTPEPTERSEPRPQIAEQKPAESEPLLFPERLVPTHRDDG